MDNSTRFKGLILGTTVGDALGLPAEGLSRDAIKYRWPGQWKHRFFFGHGMYSDDTEHTIMIAQSLIEHPTDVFAFSRSFAQRLRLWILLFPAGVGLATMKASFKLWIGFSPKRSGVFSAGNGPAMRSAIIGAYFFNNPILRKQYVDASTQMTHTDPKANIAAQAVSEIAAAIVNDPLHIFPFEILSSISHDTGWINLVEKMKRANEKQLDVYQFAELLGLKQKITGYAWHSVPMAIYAWWYHRGNFRLTLESVINCGGDTDTVGAIAGALAGCDLGPNSIPDEWINKINEWPRSINWVNKIADALHSANTRKVPRYFWPAIPLRNLFFLSIVLAHAIWRIPMSIGSVLQKRR